MALTDLAVRKMKPGLKEIELADGGGLYLRIRPTGTKSWVFRYRFNGRPRRMTLGGYPKLSPKEARNALLKAIGKLDAGIDPGREKIEKREARATEPTFSQLLGEFWEIELKQKKSGLATRKVIEKDCLKPWGWKKVSEIKRRDIVILLDRVRDRAPVLANRLLGYLSRLFNFAAERGIIDDSPCTRIRKPTAEKPRDRALSDNELKAIWEALDLESMKIDIYRISKLALKMMLLTGQRPGEVVGMRFDELGEDGFWNIPGNRRKGGEPNRVPLCQMALDVIELAKVYSAGGEYVFRSSYKPGQPITRHSLSRAVSRHWDKMGLNKKFTPHDLRRTVRTRLAEVGASDIVAERVLGHKLQGMLGVYNQYSYDEEKRQVLMQWERRLKEILGLEIPESKVIELGVRNVG